MNSFTALKSYSFDLNIVSLIDKLIIIFKLVPVFITNSKIMTILNYRDEVH